MIPPKPKPLMAARRGWFLGRGQGWGSRRILKGELGSWRVSGGEEKFAVGGRVWSRMARRILMRPAAPAAVRRWPTLLLTEPMMQGLGGCSRAGSSVGEVIPGEPGAI